MLHKLRRQLGPAAAAVANVKVINITIATIVIFTITADFDEESL